MGLDMYLEKKSYVKNWDYMKPEAKHAITIKKAGKVRKDIKPERVTYIVEEVAYWRKANMIHDWFIRECADGDGDRTRMHVSFEQLQELVETCRKVLSSCKLVKGKIKNGEHSDGKGGWEPIMEDGEYIEDATLAKKLLPTTKGFFFGSTEYDQYYVKDLKDTIEMLEPVLKEEGADMADYEYVASW